MLMVNKDYHYQRLSLGKSDIILGDILPGYLTLRVKLMAASGLSFTA